MLIVDNLHAGPVQDQLLELMSEYLYNWRNLGLIAMVTALFIGSGWVANLNGVLRGMMRPDFDMVKRQHNPLFEPIINVVILLALMLLMFALVPSHASDPPAPSWPARSSSCSNWPT